jgi:hypothetical protein
MKGLRLWCVGLSLLAFCGVMGTQSSSASQALCNRTLFANVVALDQPIMVNRLADLMHADA